MQQGSHVSSSASEDFSLQSHPGAELGGAEARCQHLICSVVRTCTDFSLLCSSAADQTNSFEAIKDKWKAGHTDTLTPALPGQDAGTPAALPRTTFAFLLFVAAHAAQLCP